MSKLRWSLRLHNGRGIEGGQNACMIRDKFDCAISVAIGEGLHDRWVVSSNFGKVAFVSIAQCHDLVNAQVKVFP